MHTKVPFLVVFFLSIFQLIVYAVLDYEEFEEVVTVDPEQVTEIEISDLSNQVHSTKDPEKIKNILDYLREFEYRRVPDDQTAYMPMNTMMINVYDGEQHDFIIPYGDEVLISHKIYQIPNGPIEESVLLDMMNPEDPAMDQ
jgi:hypothetical protein